MALPSLTHAVTNIVYDNAIKGQAFDGEILWRRWLQDILADEISASHLNEGKRIGHVYF